MRPVLEVTTRPRRRGPNYDGRPATLKEFDNLPDDGYRYELHDGILRMSPAPSTNHDRIVTFLVSKIFAFLEHHPIGEVFQSDYDVQLTSKRVYRPDVKFVAEANRRIIGKKRLIGAPDLAVEVVSPDDPDRDWRVKFNAYQKAGVREYWIIDSESLSAAFYLHDGKQFVKQEVRGNRYHSAVIEGFRLDLKALASYVNRPMGDD